MSPTPTRPQSLCGLAVAVIAFFCLVSVSDTTDCRSSMTLYANFTKQFLTSPDYPQFFPRPSYCKWTIVATQGNRLVFRIWDFDLEASIFCYKDLFTLLDGSTGYELDLLSLCGGFTSSNLYKTSGDAATVELRGVNPGDDHRGFNISFWTEFKLDLQEREVSYGFTNYVLWGLSAAIFLSFVVAVVVLLKVHWQQIVDLCASEDDEECDILEVNQEMEKEGNAGVQIIISPPNDEPMVEG
ncbi:dorsal-ventral patterning protein tolloid [Aplysia californica]|uniref:Dorsal-ventral patterning protein tolloid n=1 Tax=Aplysia californica TaxID=6500 RepID=A0ABM1VWD6_APLCA|nr:dorsal-ventral patterning protein tolloid [Aplysia californica]